MNKFLDKLCGQLHIKLSKKAEQISPNLYNVFAEPDAKVESVSLEPQVYDKKDFRDLTEAEFKQVAFDKPSIKLKSMGDVVAHQAPNGIHFTVKDLLNAVEETERQTRHQSDWFGGVDVHHIYFEGVRPGKNGVWEISWGS